jgi:hypothetical protein
MHRGINSLALAGCLVATLAVAAQAQSAPETKGPEAFLKQPIVFYVAKGAPGACGPGCSEWIAAEGTIDPAAEPRLWELLRKLGNDRKPPVYFHSPGGSVTAGLQIGRLMRARGLTVGVGWTLPATCERQNPGAPACDALKHSGRELAAELDVSAGFCASSCSYTILGGAVRNIGVGARVGIHDAYTAPTIRSFDENGRVVDRPQSISAERARAGLAQTYGVIAAYVNAMGISVDLVKAAHAIPSDKLHILTREELVAFGIDRRDAVESGWSLVDKSSGVSAVKLIETRDGTGGTFRRAMLSLTCRDATTMRLQYLHQVGAEAESEPAALRVTAGSRSFPLMRLGSAAQGQDGDRGRVENHGAELPLAALDAASFVIETAATSGLAANSPAPPSTRLAVQGAAPALGALARRCGSGGR